MKIKVPEFGCEQACSIYLHRMSTGIPWCHWTAWQGITNGSREMEKFPYKTFADSNCANHKTFTMTIKTINLDNYSKLLWYMFQYKGHTNIFVIPIASTQLPLKNQRGRHKPTALLLITFYEYAACIGKKDKNFTSRTEQQAPDHHQLRTP